MDLIECAYYCTARRAARRRLRKENHQGENFIKTSGFASSTRTTAKSDSLKLLPVISLRFEPPPSGALSQAKTELRGKGEYGEEQACEKRARGSRLTSVYCTTKRTEWSLSRRGLAQLNVLLHCAIHTHTLLQSPDYVGYRVQT